MSFKLGLVGLCTSHPAAWVPIIRTLTEEKLVDIEVVAAWDSGETRPEGFAAEFCQEHNIPHAVEKLDQMIDLVDGVIVHTTNWDKHLEQAEKFVMAGKAVYLDKPIVGNMADANRFLDWIKQGYKVTGGSVLRFCKEVGEFLARPEEERGKVYSAYTAIGVDDFNYGIHGYAMLLALFGTGLESVRYLGSSNQKQLQLNWSDGRIGLMTMGPGVWLPFTASVVTDKNVYSLSADLQYIYRAMLEKVLPWFCGLSDQAPLTPKEILEAELAAMAAQKSWNNNGQLVFLSDLESDYAGYDGTQFALEYRRARLGSK